MSGPAALSSALTGDVGVTPRLAARARAPTARRGGRSPSPVAWTRRRSGDDDARVAASPGPGPGATVRVAPARVPSSSHRPGSLLVARAAPSEDDDTPLGAQTEVMRSVAERVKAARELAKRLASKEEGLNAPGPRRESAEGGGAVDVRPRADDPDGSYDEGDDASRAHPDGSGSYDEDVAAAAESDLAGDYRGGDDAAAAAAAAAAKLAEMEAAAAKAEEAAFAARAVSQMDEAVTRIRQEAAKRVAAAERERDRAKEEAKTSAEEAVRRATALEETLRQVKADADARVEAAENAQLEWEILAETARVAKEQAEEQAATKIRVTEEAARVGIGEADERAEQERARADEAIRKAEQDVEAAKMVQETITRQEKEKAEAAAAAAERDAAEKIARADARLAEAVEAARLADAGAKSEAEEILKEELSRTEEALNAAEEIAGIEVAAAEEAAALLVAEMEEKMTAAVAAAEAKATRAIDKVQDDANRRVAAANEKAEMMIAEAKAEAEEAAKTAEAIAAAKDAVAAAVESAEADVLSARTAASDAEAEVTKIREAADAQIAEITENFQTQIEEARREAAEKAAGDVAAATARAQEAESKIDAAVAAAEAKAEASIAAAEDAASEKIDAAKKQRDEAVAAAKADAAAQVEAARADAAEKIDAARDKTKGAREEAKAAAAEAKRAAEWEVEAAKAYAEAEAAAAREAEAAAAKFAAEEAKQEALNTLIETELEAQRARDETAAERANVEKEIAKRDVAVAEAVAAANEVSARELDRIRQEGAQPAVEAREAQAAAEEEARAARAEAEYEKARANAAAAEAAAALDAVRLERDLAEQRAAEAERVREELIAGDSMEREIEFEKRVAAATAEADAETGRQRARADVAESDLSDAKQKIESLRAELDTASAELALMSNEETRGGISKERVTTEIAKLTVALEARDAEIATLRANLESVAAGKGLVVDFQNANGAGDAAPASEETTQETPKSAEEAELEELLNEVMQLKGENASLEAARGGAGEGEMAAVEAVQTMESVYAEAYHAALAARKAARRKEAEAWTATQVAVVASSIPEVYHWLGGGARHGDSAIVYNRRNPNGLGDGGQCFMHLGYNGWQGDPRQVGMRPLQHDHPARAELWLNDKGGDWWIAEPVFVHPEASVIDFVFSDGEGDYDNFGGKDYHSPVGAENGDPVDDVDHVGERERQLEAEQGHLDAQFAERAGRRAERQFLSRRGFDPKIEEDIATKKVVTMPPQLVAGQEIEIFYRHHEDPDPNAPLRGASDVFVQGGFNRWTHGESFGPLRMEPAQNPPGGERAQPALVARVRVPQDAHVVDFVFTDDARSMHGRYDSKDGLDYHASTVGAGGSAMPCLRVVQVAVEMAPIAKVGGMGDVVTALSRAVIEKGHSVEVVLPKYDCMDHEQIDDLNLADQFLVDDVKVSVWKGEVEEVPVTFLQPDNGHFDVGCIYGRGDDHVRFEFFSKCALEYMTHAGDVPDIVHAHDWSTSHCVFARKSQLPPGAATCLTIHNLQFGQDLIGRAMRACTFATTVSPTYAEEIKEQGAIDANQGKMVGIRNGIDVSIWNPMTDEFLSQNYDMDSWQVGKAAARQQLAERLGMNFASAETPLVAVVSRLTQQKGIHLIKHACYRTLERGGQFVLLGSSPDGNVQNDFNSMAYDVGGRFPGQSGFVFAYDEPLSHLVYAAADMLLVPSMFEPCGLTQLIAMRYGTVPVVRRTGGLRDTVFDVDEDSLRAQSQGLKVNGFSFDGSHDHDIEYALDRAMMMYSSDATRWQELVNGIMRQDWGWTDPAEAYVEQYWKAAKSMKDAYFIEQSQTRR